MTNEQLLTILKSEMVPAMGCTEPAASALAGAKARELLGVIPEKCIVYASRDIVKNAMGVGLPNCSLKGILASVALGIAGGKTEKGLSILSEINNEQIEIASKIECSLNLVTDVPPLYIKVTVIKDSDTASACISGEHDRVSYLEKNGEVLLSLPLKEEKEEGKEKLPSLSSLTMSDIYNFAISVKKDDALFILDAIKINSAISLTSINGHYGIEVGRTAWEGHEENTLNDAFLYGAALAASGSDARMSGCPMPVIINSGSGNQGITVTVPVATVADFLSKSEEEKVRAVLISELVGLTLTAKKDRLSALCGAFTASIGTSAAYVYLLGGKVKEMDRAVNTMIGDMTGIICDGAKCTCALKIFSSLEAAALASKMAMKGLSPGSESGIVGDDSLESISYLSRISREGMEETDKTILEIMLEKKC